MSRRLRYIPPEGALVELTNRTTQGRYLLRPGIELNRVVAGVLGRAQRLYGVEIHACVFLSDHFHLLMTVQSARQMADFMRYFQGYLAIEVGKLHDWRGHFWERRYQHVIVSEEASAQFARFRYLLENSCKEDLVDSPLDWPGLHSAKALQEGESLSGIWINRTRERQERNQRVSYDPTSCREPETVTFSPLPCWKHLDAMACQKRVADIIEDIEHRTRERHRLGETQPLGKERILRVAPHQRPNMLKRSPAPMFHCATKAVRRALWTGYAWFYAAFREAAERLRDGDLTAVFPEGSFPPAAPFLHPARAPG